MQYWKYDRVKVRVYHSLPSFPCLINFEYRNNSLGIQLLEDQISSNFTVLLERWLSWRRNQQDIKGGWLGWLSGDTWSQLVASMSSFLRPPEEVCAWDSIPKSWGIFNPQWEFQDPKMEVLTSTICIGLIYGRYLHFRILKFPLKSGHLPTLSLLIAQSSDISLSHPPCWVPPKVRKIYPLVN